MDDPFDASKLTTPKADDGGKGDVVAGVGSSAVAKIKEAIGRAAEFNAKLERQVTAVIGATTVNGKPLPKFNKLEHIKQILKNHGMDSQQQEKAFTEIKNILEEE